MKFIKFYDDEPDDIIISQYAQKFGINEIVMRIIFSKGYKTEEQISEFLYPTKQGFKDPFLMLGMKECVEKIKQAVSENKKILVFGDYDVDGVSATAIMLKTLKKLGNSATSYLPNRYVDGYGLTKQVLNKIMATNKPDLIITVDCGISCSEEVEYCFQNGIDIVVTDHHEIPEVLPKTIIVNPKLQQEYNFNGLCGTGVAFKIAQALLGEQATEEFLPIAALATIADIVPLINENRVIVSKGLELMKKHLPIGIKELVKECKLKVNLIECSDIAFKIAPKLNASGRMGDANDSLELFLETDPVKIRALIKKIIGHNTKRQELCSVVYEDCKKMIEEQNMSEMPAIILSSKNWDHGILGIACARLLEEYNRPVFLFSENGEELKGSARSLNDINVHNVLQSVQDILEVFGGHKVAAGLTLKKQNFQEFKNRVTSFIYENISDRVFVPIEYYDYELTLKDLSSSLISDLKRLEPCGCDNPRPKFLIKTSSAQILPLKSSPAHANIIIGKKLNLIFFQYFKEQAKLNFGKEYKFIFELQNENKSFYKGVIKCFASSPELKENAKQYIDGFAFSQLKYLKNKNTANFLEYNSKDILQFIVDCSSSVFGTCFVTYNYDLYKNFISSYDMSNIYETNILSTTNTGFNAIFVSPTDLEFCKSYKKIIFLDTILDESFLANINKISNAKIYIPKDEKIKKDLIKNINFDKRFANIVYQNLLAYENSKNPSVLSIFTKLIKEKKLKISFNNFLFYFFIFCELNLINIQNIEGFFAYKINKNLKSDLNNSSIYNFIKLLEKIS